MAREEKRGAGRVLRAALLGQGLMRLRQGEKPLDCDAQDLEFALLCPSHLGVSGPGNMCNGNQGMGGCQELVSAASALRVATETKAMWKHFS